MRVDRSRGGADQHRRTERSAPPHPDQLASGTAGCGTAVPRAGGGAAEHRRAAPDLAARPGRGRLGTACSRRPVPGRRDGRGTRGGEPRSSRGDPLHLGHDRGLQGSGLPARSVLLVGPQCHGPTRHHLGRRAAHLPAAVPHERAQRVQPGAGQRCPVRHRPAFLGLPLLVGRDGQRGDLHLSAGCHDQHPGRPSAR